MRAGPATVIVLVITSSCASTAEAPTFTDDGLVTTPALARSSAAPAVREPARVVRRRPTTTRAPTTASPPRRIEPGRASKPSATSTSSSTTTDPTTTGPPNAIRRVTVAFTGDTLTHSPLWDQAQRNAGGAGYDFGPMQARLRPLLDGADVAVCHLETPIAPEGEALSTAPVYGVPVEVVDGLVAAGYDRCSTASNHALDRGTAGVDRTVAVLESRGIEQAGMARTPEEIGPKVFGVRVEGGWVRLSHLSYTSGYNGIVPPAGQEWRSAMIDPARIIDDARAARRLGAELVLVSLHWGAERIATPTPDQVAIADQITASGAVDLIVGHHAHVLQPVAQVNGRWVLYGLGNILSNLPTSPSWPASSQDGAVATVAFNVTRDGAVLVEQPIIHPTWVDRDAGWIVRLVLADLADPSTPAGLRPLLEASLARTTAVVGPYLAAAPPPPRRR